MSDFLSNLLSRHTQGENVVQPRGKSSFEAQQPMTKSYFSPFEGESVNQNSSPNLSESRSITPDSVQFPSNEPRKNGPFKKVDNFPVKEAEAKSVAINPKRQNKTESNVQNKTENKTRVLPQQVVKKLKLATKSSPFKNAIAARQKQLKIETAGKSILDSRLENSLEKKSDKNTSNPNSPDLDKQPVPSFFSDQLLVSPKKEIDQQLLYTSYNNGHRENSSKGNNDNSNGNQTPTVKIHIGRIDIKAVGSPILKTPSFQKASKKSMSLQQFLKKREGK